MRSIVSIAALAATLLTGGSALAEDVTPQYAFRTGLQIMANAEAGKQVHCERPLKNTVDQCQADFDAFIRSEAEMTARQALYLLAKDGNDSRKTLRLKQEFDSVVEQTIRLGNNLDRDYVPKQTTGQKRNSKD